MSRSDAGSPTRCARLGRVGAPMECALVIAFLASEGASYVVWETIEVNGGQLML